MYISGQVSWFILIHVICSHYLQFSIKCNISIADEQKYISQTYAIDFFMSSLL